MLSTNEGGTGGPFKPSFGLSGYTFSWLMLSTNEGGTGGPFHPSFGLSGYTFSWLCCPRMKDGDGYQPLRPAAEHTRVGLGEFLSAPWRSPATHCSTEQFMVVVIAFSQLV